jgi:hypothetical protein
MQARGCTPISASTESTLHKWPFDDLQGRVKGFTFCGIAMASNYSNYICNATLTKQCGVNFCVGPNEPCPLKGLLLSQGGVGKSINDKWKLVEVPMGGN